MINSRLSLIFMILLALAQLGFVSNMIWEKNSILKHGQEFRFKTRPIDPYDPFRGKYIVLNYVGERRYSFPCNGYCDETKKRPFYVILEQDSLGFSTVKSVEMKKPKDDNYFEITTTARKDNYTMKNGNVEQSTDSMSVYVDFPFDKFYMDEFKAPQAELELSRARNLQDSLDVYAVVAIKDGETQLKDVIVDSLPIVEWLEIYGD